MEQNKINPTEENNVPVVTTTASRVSCNGGGGALGHPLVWLNLGEDGKVTCPYCSKQFVKAAS